MLKCIRCKITKNVSMFYKNKCKVNGRQAHCKICHDKSVKKWRKANPDKYSTYNCNPRRNEEMKAKSKMRSRQHRHDMSDRYIRDLMTMHTTLKPEDIPEALVECHRVNLKLKRMLKLTKKLKPT